MKKSTTDTQPLADAAAEFIAENTNAPRAESKPHRKAAKNGKRPSKKAARKASPKKAGKVSAKAAPEKSTRAKSDPKLPAFGEKIVRVYKGKTYEVEVLKDGFQYKGKVYPSLTATAMAITGYKAISGPVFFRLTAKDKPEGK
jgi:hypothetical protein